MVETDIYERLGGLTAKIEGALRALEAASAKGRANDRRIETLRLSVADMTARIEGLTETVKSQVIEIERRLDRQDAMLDSIERALAVLRGGWKGAAAIGALLVGAGGLATALARAFGIGFTVGR